MFQFHIKVLAGHGLYGKKIHKNGLRIKIQPAVVSKFTVPVAIINQKTQEKYYGNPNAHRFCYYTL